LAKKSGKSHPSSHFLEINENNSNSCARASVQLLPSRDRETDELEENRIE